jgi:hypothetical protein
MGGAPFHSPAAGKLNCCESVRVDSRHVWAAAKVLQVAPFKYRSGESIKLLSAHVRVMTPICCLQLKIGPAAAARQVNLAVSVRPFEFFIRPGV